MMLSRFRKVLCRTALGALVALGANGAAQATLVVGVFDPAFGAALSGVNYSGTASFNIAQSCLNNSLADAQGVFIYSVNTCSGNATLMSFQGADVAFTDGGGNTIGSLHFNAIGGAIIGMFVQNHSVVGVQSELIGPATVMSGLLSGDQFELVFGQTNPVHDPGETGEPERGDGDHDYDDQMASYFTATHLILVGGSACTQPGVTCPSLSNAAATRFAAVPEPGTLALVLGALGAGWLTRAKKRRATGAPLAA
jgi:hypothetical protein